VRHVRGAVARNASVHRAEQVAVFPTGVVLAGSIVQRDSSGLSACTRSRVNYQRRRRPAARAEGLSSHRRCWPDTRWLSLLMFPKHRHDDEEDKPDGGGITSVEGEERREAQAGDDQSAGSSLVHTGEVETIAGKAGGLAVVIGARVGGAVGPSEVFASQTVKDLTAGSGLLFEDAGDYTPARTSMPSGCIAATTARAHFTALAGPSNVAKNPSPAVSISVPLYRPSMARTVA
jgi:hypothetical protein